MKVLHIINWMQYGGAQSLITDLLDVQKKSGLDVSLLCLIGIEKNGFLCRLEESGVPVFNVQDGGNMRNPLMIFKLIPYIKKYDVVHFHSFPDEYWVPFSKMISCAKCKLIYTVHSSHSSKYGHPIYRHIDNFVYKHLIDHVACCSDKALETFQANLPGISAYSVPNGIKVAKYSDAQPSDLSSIVSNDCNFVVIMVARFQYPKRQDVLIKALTKLPSNIHVLFVGGKEDDQHYAEYINLAKDTDVYSRAHFLGIRNDIPNLLKAADVVVLSSEYEGLSLSCLEGMAAGKPFVGTNADGLREILSGSGLMFENGDSEGLATQIMNLYSNKEYYNKISRQCLEKAQLYDIKYMAEKYNQLYNM